MLLVYHNSVHNGSDNLHNGTTWTLSQELLNNHLDIMQTVPQLSSRMSSSPMTNLYSFILIIQGYWPFSGIILLKDQTEEYIYIISNVYFLLTHSKSRG